MFSIYSRNKYCDALVLSRGGEVRRGEARAAGGAGGQGLVLVAP